MDFDGTKTTKQKNKELISDMDDLIESMILLARLTRAKYDALLSNGFTEHQALELCKNK